MLYYCYNNLRTTSVKIIVSELRCLFTTPICWWFQEDPDDLPFRKGDVMTVLRKDEDEWWFAQHEDGRQGSIPVPYIQIVSLGLV